MHFKLWFDAEGNYDLEIDSYKIADGNIDPELPVRILTFHLAIDRPEFEDAGEFVIAPASRPTPTIR